MTLKISDFLRKKLRSYSIYSLIRLQIESLILFIVGPLPTTIGFVLRFFVLKVLAKRIDGFIWVQPSVILVHTEKIIFGNNVGINSFTYINGVGGIEFGDFVLIGSGVTISSGKHPIDGRLIEIFRRPVIPQKIIIEDDVWIGANSVILPGVRLAKGSVIGANSVVTSDTLPYSINVGAPSRRIRFRKENE